MSTIAVILVNYNGLKDTLECIKSIKESKCSSDIKIIVVDNASKKDEISDITKSYNDVVTIRSSINGGFSYGNNIGIKYALSQKYEYIMLLNNDTIILPDMIERLRAKVDKYHVAVPKMLYYSDKKSVWYGGGYINYKTGAVNHYTNNELENENRDECDFATGCCIMLTSETIEKIGLMEEKYFLYCEDVEYSLRLKKNSIKIKYVPDAILYHKVGSSGGGDRSALSLYYINRNRFYYIKDYKEYFSHIALSYTFITRFIKFLLEKDKDKKNAYRKAIKETIFKHK